MCQLLGSWHHPELTVHRTAHVLKLGKEGLIVSGWVGSHARCVTQEPQNAQGCGAGQWWCWDLNLDLGFALVSGLVCISLGLILGKRYYVSLGMFGAERPA